MAVFVDDILVASRSDAVLAQVKAEFQDRFTMTDEGLAQEFLGVLGVALDQQHYCETIVRDFQNYIGCMNYSEVPMQADAELFVPYEPTPEQAAWVARFPYATIVGKIVYLTAITRPDIAYAVSMLSRFMAQPTYRACMAVTRLLNYLSRTAHYGLVYHADDGDQLNMHAYSDSNWATCPVTRRSISGTVVVSRLWPHPQWKPSTSQSTTPHRTPPDRLPSSLITRLPALWLTTQFTMPAPNTSM
jgi:hypothetical protein